MEEPLGFDEQSHIDALKTCDEGHIKYLKQVEDIGNSYRVMFNGVYESQPASEFRPKLREAQSNYYAMAQSTASFHFREDESLLQKDVDNDFHPWQYIPTREEREQRSRCRSKEAAEEVGYKGEKFVFGYLKNLYQDKPIEVKWCNEAKESGQPYDLTLWNKAEGELTFVEVKSTSVSGRDYFFLSHRELNWARSYKERYIIVYVSVDLDKKPPNEQCSVIKVYKNPANLPELKLSMFDVSNLLSE